jgi:hypothetical protein
MQQSLAFCRKVAFSRAWESFFAERCPMEPTQNLHIRDGLSPAG